MAEREVSDGGCTVCTVVGGRSSFIGRSLVSMLLRSFTNWTVRIADFWPSLNLNLAETDSMILSDSVRSDRLSYFQIDIRDVDSVSRAIRGSSVVFVMDVSNASAKSFYDQYMFTVKGMKNVINACRKFKVERLIYNSSADVVFDGIHDVSHGNELLHYPCKFQDGLYDLKVQAEALVLSANSCNGLSTCALRPCNPFGPGDPDLIPSLISSIKSSWAQLVVGVGHNMSDFTFVDNISHAHICAENALRQDKASVSGKAFFISNLQPMKTGDFAASMLSDLGFHCFRPSFHLPSTLVQFILVLFGLISNYSLKFDEKIKFLLKFFCTKTFDCSNAQKHLGYSPIVPLQDGIELTAKLSPHLAFDPSSEFDIITSKAQALLGTGTVSDILLWRDEKRSFYSALSMFLLFYWFLFSGRTFITSTAELLFLACMIFFGYGHLPSSLVGSRSEMTSLPYFEVSETSVREAVSWVSSAWNKSVSIMESIARGEDWALLIKAIAALFLFKIFIQLSSLLIFTTGWVVAFTVFIIYEQHESQFDEFLTKVANQARMVRSSLLSN